MSSNSSQNNGLNWSWFGCARLWGDFEKCVCSHFAHADSKAVGWLTDRNKVSFLQWVRGINISCAHTQYVWRYLGCVVWLNSMMWGFWVFSFAFYVIKGKETCGYSCWHDQKEWIWLIVLYLWFPFLDLSPTLSILLLFYLSAECVCSVMPLWASPGSLFVLPLFHLWHRCKFNFKAT